MNNLKTIEGFVLKKLDYEDYDEIITVFSKEYGLISFYAPGVRRMTSKNKTALQLFNSGYFEIFKSPTTRLSKLKKAHLLETYIKIADAYFSYLLASAITTVSLSFFSDDEKSYEYYQLLKFIFTKLDQHNFLLKNFAIYLYRSLKYNNSLWDLTHCASCQKKLSHPQFLSLFDYGVVCDQDFAFMNHQDKVLHDAGLIVVLNQIATLPIEEFDGIQLDIKAAILLINVSLEYYENVLGVSSTAFYEIKMQPFLRVG